MCGHCHPPKLRAVFCPDCGEYNLFKIIVCDPPLERLCKKCGRDLTPLATPKTVRCKKHGAAVREPVPPIGRRAEWESQAHLP